MDSLGGIFKTISNLLWGPATIAIILGIGIFVTVANRFFQIFHFGDVFKNTVGSLFKKNNGGNKGISPFRAVSTALAGSIGTGNIFGVASAIFLGGPGAIFWIWVSALFGMMLKYSEVVLAVKYRQNDGNGYYGGPMYVIEEGLGLKFVGKLFAVLCALASFGIGSTVQANCAANAIERGFFVPKIVTSVVMVLVCAVVVIGGIKRLSNMACAVVPVMSLIYIVISVVVLVINFKFLPDAFSSIFRGAFSFKATVSGGAGYIIIEAMRSGISKSVFVSEAGLGSAPIAHAASNAKSPVAQGLWGIFEVFFSTMIMCTMTALVVIVTGVLHSCKVEETLTLSAFSTVFGSFSDVILSVCTALFAFTTTMSWAYYGEQSITYCFGKKWVIWYRLLYITTVGIGGICKMTLVFDMANIFNLMMAVPNLIAIALLSPQVVKLTREYCKRGLN